MFIFFFSFIYKHLYIFVNGSIFGYPSVNLKIYFIYPSHYNFAFRSIVLCIYKFTYLKIILAKVYNLLFHRIMLHTI